MNQERPTQGSTHLARWRRQRGLSYHALAKRLGFAVSVIEKTEKGRNTPRSALRQALQTLCAIDPSEWDLAYTEEPGSLDHICKAAKEQGFDAVLWVPGQRPAAVKMSEATA